MGDGVLSIADQAQHKPIRAKPPVVAPRPSRAVAAAPAGKPAVVVERAPEVLPTGVQTLAQTPSPVVQPASDTPPTR